MKDRHRVVALAAGEGRSLSAGVVDVRFLAVSEDTGGRSSVEEFLVPAAFDGPPPHIHDTSHHSWYVLEGQLTLTAGDRRFVLEAGGFVHVPAGTPHTFANHGPSPGRMVQFTTPGGFERYLEELTEAFPRGAELDPDKIIEIMARYDTHPA